MRLVVPKKIGNKTYMFQVEGETLHDVLMEERKLAFRDVPKCGLCESENLYMTAYITKDGNSYKYAKIACAKCGGSVTFGSPKASPEIFYLRKNEDMSLKWEERPEETKKEEVPTVDVGEETFPL